MVSTWKKKKSKVEVKSNVKSISALENNKKLQKELCRNPSFGLATKAKRLQRCGPRASPGVTSHTLGSIGKCEGVNIHTPKATPTLGDGVPVDF